MYYAMDGDVKDHAGQVSMASEDNFFKQLGSDKGLSYDGYSLVECMLSRQLKRNRESVLHLDIHTTHI